MKAQKEVIKSSVNICFMGCPKCSGNKRRKSHTFAAYKIKETPYKYIFRCKTCGYEVTTLKLASAIDFTIAYIEEFDQVIFNKVELVSMLEEFKVSAEFVK